MHYSLLGKNHAQAQASAFLVPVPSPDKWGRFHTRFHFHTRSVMPGLPKAATGTVDWQGANGNYATVGRRRRRGGRHVRGQRERRKGRTVEVRVRTLDVGTMTSKGRKLDAMMESRK